MNCCVIIVNYRTADLTVQCLRSLAEERRLAPALRVVVVDNASEDGSMNRLQRAIDDEGWVGWIELLPLDRNGGFAYGNNAGIRHVLGQPQQPEYLLLLNPDTIVHPGAVRELARHLEMNPKAGIAGSRLEDPDGSPQVSAFRYHSILSELENGARLGLLSKMLATRIVARPTAERPFQTDWVSGASMMVRREVFEKIGLLDEAYFMYFEEVDFCLRAQRAGFECWHVPQSRVIHLVGKASGINDPARPRRRRPGYWFDSRRRYFLKHHGRLRAILADLAWSSGYAFYRVRRVIQRKPDTDAPRLLWDFLRHSAMVPHRPIGKQQPAQAHPQPRGAQKVPLKPFEEAR